METAAAAAAAGVRLPLAAMRTAEAASSSCLVMPADTSHHSLLVSAPVDIRACSAETARTLPLERSPLGRRFRITASSLLLLCLAVA